MLSTAGCQGVTDWGGEILSESISPDYLSILALPYSIEVPELGRCDDFPLQSLSAIHFRPFVRWRFVNCVNSLIAASACDKDLGSGVQALPGLIAARKMFCQNHQCLSKPDQTTHVERAHFDADEKSILWYISILTIYTTTLTIPPLSQLRLSKFIAHNQRTHGVFCLRWPLIHSDEAAEYNGLMKSEGVLQRGGVENARMVMVGNGW